jgi:RNase P subunit RPR2
MNQLPTSQATPISRLTPTPGSRPRETRMLTCPKCDTQLKDPDRVSGYQSSLKYLVWGIKCRNCGTQLVDLGVDANDKVERPRP